MRGLVYLASAVDLALDAKLVDYVARKLAELGFATYVPSRPFEHPDTLDGQAIQSANFAVIDEAADFMFVIVETHTFSYGTVLDIERAVDAGVPVFVWLRGATMVPAYMQHLRVFAQEGHNSPAEEALEQFVSYVRTTPQYMLMNARNAIARIGRVLGPFCTAACQDEAPVRSEIHLHSVVPDGHTHPTKSYPNDAGFDLYVLEDRYVGAGKRHDIEVGTRLAIPDGYWGLILGRSSTFYKLGLEVHPAVIDSGWRGELRVSVYNPTDDDVTISAGDRIAQLIPIASPVAHIVPVDELPDGERGEQGFGSSGR